MEMKRRFLTELANPEKVFYLTCFAGQNAFQEEVFFVNNSDEKLDYVRPASGGFATSDDEVIPMNQKPDSIVYRDVQPNEAVMIDVYNSIFDGDFVISWGVELKSPSLGEQYFGSDHIKGEAPNITLHWKPLPEEMENSDDPKELIDPAKVAETYKQSSGLSLPSNVEYNKGSLLYHINMGFLNTCDLHFVKESLRDGKAANYRFLDKKDVEIFRTLDLDRAMAFVGALKAD